MYFHFMKGNINHWWKYSWRCGCWQIIHSCKAILCVNASLCKQGKQILKIQIFVIRNIQILWSKILKHGKHFNWWPLATCKAICGHSMAASLTFEANTLISPILNFRLGTVWKVEVVGRFLGKCRNFDLIDSIYIFFWGGVASFLIKYN